jgi:cell division protein FtsB
MRREDSSSTFVIPFGLLIFAIIAVPFHLLDGQGVPRYRALSSELAKVRSKNERLRREIRELRIETELLRTDPRAIEQIAREELGMVRDGELVLQFPNAPN